MLALPDNGMLRSISAHNIVFEYLCDWIEGNILFDETEDKFSVVDIVDVLISENIYDEQDFAEKIVIDAWIELKRRANCIDSEMAFSVVYPTVKRTRSWEDTPAHSFCVLLSLAQCYKRWWVNISEGGYREQGELFELLTQESLETQFSDWCIRRTGWYRTEPTELRGMVNRIANWLGEDTGDDINAWVSSDGRDMGLDLLCYRPFPDNRTGFPVYLMQCASGQNWTEKVYQPNIDLWQRLVNFVVRPQKAFAIPFALSDDDFRKQCVLIQGLFLDRCRLLAAARFREQWESSSLKDRIIRWAMPRIDQLPRN